MILLSPIRYPGNDIDKLPCTWRHTRSSPINKKSVYSHLSQIFGFLEFSHLMVTLWLNAVRYRILRLWIEINLMFDATSCPFLNCVLPHFRFSIVIKYTNAEFAMKFDGSVWMGRKGIEYRMKMNKKKKNENRRIVIVKWNKLGKIDA